jgi:hypothetical protein
MEVIEGAQRNSRAWDSIVLIGSREDAKAQRGQYLTHNLCAFAASYEILSNGYLKNCVPAFAGMTDSLGTLHD